MVFPHGKQYFTVYLFRLMCYNVGKGVDDMNSKGVYISGQLFKELGFSAAAFYDFIIEEIEKTGSEWVELTLEKVKKEYGFSYNKQKLAIKKLIEAGYIEKELIGFPAKRCFKIKKPVE